MHEGETQDDTREMQQRTPQQIREQRESVQGSIEREEWRATRLTEATAQRSFTELLSESMRQAGHLACILIIH